MRHDADRHRRESKRTLSDEKKHYVVNIGTCLGGGDLRLQERPEDRRMLKTGDSLGFYVNGKRVHSQQNVRSKTEIRTLRLGMDGLSHIGGDDFYSGQIDEIRIFNRALTPTEILKVYRE